MTEATPTLSPLGFLLLFMKLFSFGTWVDQEEFYKELNYNSNVELHSPQVHFNSLQDHISDKEIKHQTLLTLNISPLGRQFPCFGKS